MVVLLHHTKLIIVKEGIKMGCCGGCGGEGHQENKEVTEQTEAQKQDQSAEKNTDEKD